MKWFRKSEEKKESSSVVITVPDPSSNVERLKGASRTVGTVVSNLGSDIGTAVTVFRQARLRRQLKRNSALMEAAKEVVG